MKKKLCVVAALSVVLLAANVYAYSFEATTFQDDDNTGSYQGVLAGEENYDVDAMEVELNAENKLTVKLLGGDDGYFARWNRGDKLKYLPGALFLNTRGLSENSQEWDYAVTLSDVVTVSFDNNGPVVPTREKEGDAYLYEVETQGLITWGEVRLDEKNEKVAVDYVAGESQQKLGYLANGWQYINNGTGLQISMTLDEKVISCLKANGDTLGLQWSQLCGNDVVQAEVKLSEVPEPATMALFGLGLLGLAGVVRRKQ